MITDDDDLHELPDPRGDDESEGEGLADEDAWHALALALPPRAPSPALRARLLASVAAPEQRLAPLRDRLARLFDVSVERSAELLALAFDPATWRELLSPGVALYHLQGGPAVAGADVGLVRVEAGARFPHHLHLGEERVLVLQGELVEDGGGRSRAGDVVVMAGGTAHAFVAGDGEALIYAVVVDGVDIPGI